MKYRYAVAELERMRENEWLTDREKEVFDLYYRRGWAIVDVAAELYISPSTVKRCLQSIRSK